MKKIFTFLFVLSTSLLLAQELSADTVALEPTWLETALKAALVFLAAQMGRLMGYALPLLNAWLKQVLHFRNAAIVADSVTEALAEMSAEVRQALADGVITDTEKAAIKEKAKIIAKEKFGKLAGFYKHDLDEFIDEQISVTVGKLLSRI